MTTRSAQRDGAESFTTPAQVNHRRYEALRAFYVEGLTYAQAGQRFGYSSDAIEKRNKFKSADAHRLVQAEPGQEGD